MMAPFPAGHNQRPAFAFLIQDKFITERLNIQFLRILDLSCQASQDESNVIE